MTNYTITDLTAISVPATTDEYEVQQSGSTSTKKATAVQVLTGGLGTKTANTLLAGPTTGADAAPTFRSLVAADIPASTLAGNANAGLFAQVRSATPTASSTGLTNWGNQQSATVADAETGIWLYGATSANNISIRYGTVPATPYKIDALIERVDVNGSSAGSYGPLFGWYNGTDKCQAIGIYGSIFVLSYSNLTAGATQAVLDANYASLISLRSYWFRIADDGTTVSFQVIPGGSPSAAFTMFSVAKASGYLGSSGYSNFFFGIDRHSAPIGALLQSLKIS